ncbi:MAG: hypothetical protein GX604_07815 [Actinobacteria bacterium]|nr:hypothetical protein [Actinomycetota bacterium]
MNVLNALQARHSTRVFRSEPIPRDTVLSIVGAALLSPSWTNTQPWEVFVAGGEPLERLRSAYLDRFHAGVAPTPDIPGVTDWPSALQQRAVELMTARSALLGLDLKRPDDKKAFGLPNYRFFGAPLVVFLGMHSNLTGWPLYDLGSFSMALMLAAQQYGVSSVPAFSLSVYPDLIRTELEVPEEVAVALGIALGYPDEEATLNSFRSTRRPFDDVVRLRGL